MLLISIINILVLLLCIIVIFIVVIVGFVTLGKCIGCYCNTACTRLVAIQMERRQMDLHKIWKKKQ